jgi:hypothetical protein
MTPSWCVPSAVGLVLVNLLVWVFVWGKTVGRVNTRLNNIEKKQEDPPMLPQCIGLFSEIKEGLSMLNGEVKTMLITLKEYQTHNEKRDTRGVK